MYKEITNDIGNAFIVKSNDDGSETWIPADESNSDYQRYLRWLENPDAEENGTIS
jgi:hypothetical protein